MDDIKKNWWVFPGFEIKLVADSLKLPVNISPVQNPKADLSAPILYLTELYGSVKVITRDGKLHTYAENLLNYKPDFKIPGSGESGLTGIVVEPKTGDLFLSMLYMDDNKPKSKVVRTSSEDGLKIKSQQTVIENIPSVLAAHQIQALSIGYDEKLYINIGDGLIDPNVSQDDTDYRGKILQTNLDGSGAEVFAKGFRNPFGATWREMDKSLYISDNGPSVDDRISKVAEGNNYGWPKSMRQNSIFWWHYTQGITALAFNNTNRFGDLFKDNLFVNLFGGSYSVAPFIKGKRMVKFELEGENVKSSDDFVRYVGQNLSSPCGLAFFENDLYFTDLYGENFNKKTLQGGRIYKIIKKEVK